MIDAEWSREDLEMLMAYSRVEPWGPRQEELRAGVIGSLLLGGARKADRSVFMPSDLFPSLAPPKPPRPRPHGGGTYKSVAEMVRDRLRARGAPYREVR